MDFLTKKIIDITTLNYFLGKVRTHIEDNYVNYNDTVSFAEIDTLFN